MKTFVVPRMKLLVGVFVLMACGALFASPTEVMAQDEPAALSLRPDWQPGQTARYELWSRRERQMTMSANGESQQSGVTVITEAEITWTVDRIEPGGTAVASMTLDWISMVLEDTEGNAQTIDSRRDSGDIPPMHQALRAMAGTPLRVTVAEDGQIQSVAGMDAVTRQIDVKELAPDERDYMRSATELAVLVAAPAEAEPGATWSTQHTWNHEVGTMHHDMTHRLESVGEVAGVPIATVISDGRMELEVDRSDIPPEAPPIDIRLLEGTRQEQVLFDLRRREAVGRNSLEQTSIEVTINLPEQTLTQRTDETVHDQVLRIAEQ